MLLEGGMLLEAKNNSFRLSLFTFILFFSSILVGHNPVEKIFTDIYLGGEWDENGFLLGNSEFEVNQRYVEFLQDFMRKNNIQSVVDIGCGDWQFSSYIDWSGINYIGYDVVEYVVNRNNVLYASPTVVFVHADAINSDLPEADLLICKDVFQHLPNQDVIKMLKKFQKIKHCLITDYVSPVAPFVLNGDIACGSYRPVDLTKEPFSVRGTAVLRFSTQNMIKQVVHIQHFH